VAGSAVPAALAATTAQAALGKAAVSASVAALVRGTLRSMTTRLLKFASGPLLAIALIGAGLVAYALPTGAPAPQEDKPSPRSEPKRAADEKNEITYSGRVLDPDDKPAVGAKVYLLPTDARPGDAPKVRAVTDQEGRFSFSAPRPGGQLFVTADGFAPAGVVRPARLDGVSLRLGRDTVAIRGRLLDVQGQPVVGATVRVHNLKVPPDDKLDKWLDAIKGPRASSFVGRDQLPLAANTGLSHFFPPATTDKDGRFEIKGVGAERAVALIVEGQAIEAQEVNVLTRPGIEDIRMPKGPGPLANEQLVFRAPTCDLVAGPGRVISGVVRTGDGGKPVAGAVVRLMQPIGNSMAFVQTTSDKDGKYRLTGAPLKPRRFGNNGVVALPPADEPLLAVTQPLPDSKDEKPATLDFELPRGLWLEGQVKDKTTGRGVPAELKTVVFPGTPEDAELRRLYFSPFGPAYRTDAEGKFCIVVVPFRGAIGARAMEGSDRYRTGVGANKIEGGIEGRGGSITFRGYPIPLDASAVNTVAEIKPEKGAKRVACELVLDPGHSVTVQVQGPDGKPVAGSQVFGLGPKGGWQNGPASAEFKVSGLVSGEKRTLLLRNPEKNLAGRFEIKADEDGPVVVKLEPAAMATGRLLDHDGKPVKQANITLSYRDPASKTVSVSYSFSGEAQTDGDGRFRVGGLLPGIGWSASVPVADGPPRRMIFVGLSLKSGETKDLGDVKTPIKEE
jgi:hypothetical protein